MPVASNGSVRLRWESTGQGPAVLLIAGQGMTMEGWWSTVPVLSSCFRVITFDNRDTGGSSRVPLPYSVAQMAADAVAVLDAAGESRAHVYGISLGACVAQEVALHHPDRVASLTLGASTPGLPLAVLPAHPALTFLARAGAMGSEEAEWAAVPYAHSPAARRCHVHRIAENIRRRMAAPIEALPCLHQAGAMAAHSTFNRLHRIAAPALVVHGAEDALLPPANAHILAESIPGAELSLWPEAGHHYIIDEPRADREIAGFLLRHSGAGATRGALGTARPEPPRAEVTAPAQGAAGGG